MKQQMSKKSKETLITFKFRYDCQDISFDEHFMYLRKTQTSVVNFCLCRMLDANEKFSESKLRNIVNTQMDNMSDKKYVSYLICSGVRCALGEYELQTMNKKEWDSSKDDKLKKLDEEFERKQINENYYKKEKKRLNQPYKFIRGGHDLFMKRAKDEISHEEFVKKRLLPYYSIGSAYNNGNRFFTLYDNFTVLFNPDQYHKFILDIHVYDKKKEQFLKLVDFQNAEKSIPVTYKIDEEYIYITFERKDDLYPEFYNKRVTDAKQNRWLAIDSNPNYIGWSVVEWNGSGSYEIIDYDVYDLKTFSDKYKELKKQKKAKSNSPERQHITNKKKHEVVHMAIALANKAAHYKCVGIAVENLDIKSGDRNKGKNYNQLINNDWVRNKFFYELSKMCDLLNMKYQEVNPEFSSTAGNFLFRHHRDENGMSYMPDMVCASVEISRRAYEFSNQYIFKTKDIKKNIVNFDIQDFQGLYEESLEEFGIESLDGQNISKIHYVLKDFGVKVKVPLEKSVLYKNPKESRFFSSKSWVKVYHKNIDEHLIYK